MSWALLVFLNALDGVISVIESAFSKLIAFDIHHFARETKKR